VRIIEAGVTWFAQGMHRYSQLTQFDNALLAGPSGKLDATIELAEPQRPTKDEESVYEHSIGFHIHCSDLAGLSSHFYSFNHWTGLKYHENTAHRRLASIALIYGITDAGHLKEQPIRNTISLVAEMIGYIIGKLLRV
jgi:hypothetical protein